ncbi:MAG: hypothetical protein E7281_00905 [Lachnospiraceae bacterium]|nr:hypothetical protein [Lachnospiraceae bacterium]
MNKQEIINMPKVYIELSDDEMLYTDGGKVKKYYNKAGTLANTFALCKYAFQIQSIGYAAAITQINIAGIVPAFICQHDAEMYDKAKTLCERYSNNVYVTASVIYDNSFWISDVTVRQGKC